MTPSMLDRIRFALAPSYRRRQAIHDAIATAAVLAFLLLVFGIVGRMDYEEELRQARVAAERETALQQAAMLACLNGGAPGLYTIDDKGIRHYIVCETYTVSDENLARRRAM